MAPRRLRALESRSIVKAPAEAIRPWVRLDAVAHLFAAPYD